MTLIVNSSDENKRTSKEAPQLCALLKETKEGLDLVRSKVQALTLNDMEGKPEDVREVVGDESREAIQYREKMMKRPRREDDPIFTRVQLTKTEKKQGKHLKKSRNGLVGLAEDFYNDVRSLLLLKEDGDQGPSSFSNSKRGGKKPFKRREIIV
ncbi:uncharacterized protein LOC113279717 [Papaver somniferum]|uniref:uncharacterized protein LOC113279717 n=1 Tax=Papaver somniferum TaxID=3469 RepID=UPI000E7040A0|nr:uncharacterized protein LOC113279717 [Papaver somniferum]